MFRRILVGDNERVFVIRKRRFAPVFSVRRVLDVHLRTRRGVRALRCEAGDPVQRLGGTIVRQFPEIAAVFTVIETGESQVALVYLDGRLSRVIPPAPARCTSRARPRSRSR